MMSVPAYDQWYLAMLRLLEDGEVHRMSDLYDELADGAGLTDADRAEQLPSGTDLTYRNRISWARTFLKKAGLVESPKRAHVRITPLGSQALVDDPPQIDNAWLMRYPSFVDWMQRSKSPTSASAANAHSVDSTASAPDPSANGSESPRETLERVHEQLRHDLADELLERVKQASPAFFEKVVVDLMLAMGYGGPQDEAGRTVGRSGDGGIDGVIDEDRLGLDRIYLQAKRWEGTVGRPVVQSFAGSLDGERATKGVLITTSSFSKDARQYVRQIAKRIVLIDGLQLAEHMIQHDVGVSAEMNYEVKRVDGDYFDPD